MGTFYLNGKPIAEVEDFSDITVEPEQSNYDGGFHLPRADEELSFTAEIHDTRETREFFKKMDFYERKAVKKMREQLRKEAKKRAKSHFSDIPERHSTPWPAKKTHNSWWQSRSKNK